MQAALGQPIRRPDNPDSGNTCAGHDTRGPGAKPMLPPKGLPRNSLQAAT
jgi:hypothetical protein